MPVEQGRRNCKSQLVVKEDAPVRCVGEKFQDCFRFGSEKSATCLELKFSLFGDLFCSAAISNVTARRDVG
jgi:hypothetical protein